jgi:FkbM family methyltransferase
VTDYHEANGCRFIAADDMIVRWRRETGREFEPETYAFLDAALRSAPGVFVDCGASTGWFAVPLSRIRPVVAVEPLPEAQARLAANLALNDATADVLVIKAAVSRTAGRTVLWRNPALPLTSGASIQVATCARPAVLEVGTVRLDDVVSEPVRAMKIDVEGHEMAVLEGAAQIIANDRPVLVLEANTQPHFDMLADWCERNGYAWSVADERNMLCTPL